MFDKLKTWPHGCWPDEAQLALLQACLLSDDDASRTAFSKWQRLLPLDFIDGSSLRMLPLLHDRLRRHSPNSPDLPRIAGIARFFWVRSQMLHRDTIELAQLFQRAGIDTILLKGAALCATVSKIGLRPMSDIDLVVRQRDIDRALDLLAGEGWTPRFRTHESMRYVSHATHLTDGKNRDLDLHWSLFHDRYLTPAEVDVLWNASVPAEVGGVPTRVLCPADQLVHTCEHGARYDATPPFRWLADALQIVRGYGDAIDWQRCADIAHRHGVLLPVQQTLAYLQEHLQLDVPKAAWDSLRTRRVPLSNRLAHAIVSRRQFGIHPFWQSLPINLLGYARWRRTRSGFTMAEYLATVNDVGMPLGESLRHFTKLSYVAWSDRLRAWHEQRQSRRAEQPAQVIPLASAPAEMLSGFHPPELHDGRVFRWTYPEGTLHLALARGDYDVSIDLLPNRDLENCGLKILFNRTLLDCQTQANRSVRCRISSDMFVDYRQQRLVLGCARWDCGPHDPRHLGLPVLRMRLTKTIAACPQLNEQQAKAA